jgi:hypothetical protein
VVTWVTEPILRVFFGNQPGIAPVTAVTDADSYRSVAAPELERDCAIFPTIVGPWHPRKPTTEARNLGSSGELRLGVVRDQAGGSAGFVTLQIGPDFVPTGPGP